MTTFISSFETLIAGSIETLSYVPMRVASAKSNITISQLPAAIIHPAEVVFWEGGDRSRVELECQIVAIKKCLELSQQSIAELYAAIRQDFVQLPSLIKMGAGVVDVSQFTIEQMEFSSSPRERVMATINVRVVVELVEGSEVGQIA